MKLAAISAACFIALAAGVFAVTRVGADADGSAAPTPVRQVDELRRSEPAPGEPLVVQGVVAEVRPDSGIVGLIDVAEAAKCGLAPCEGCTRFTLPVAWEGDLPEPGQTLVVAGRIEQGATGLVLAGGRTTRR
jgi:hypothetical protein